MPLVLATEAFPKSDLVLKKKPPRCGGDGDDSCRCRLASSSWSKNKWQIAPSSRCAKMTQTHQRLSFSMGTLRTHYWHYISSGMGWQWYGPKNSEWQHSHPRISEEASGTNVSRVCLNNVIRNQYIRSVNVRVRHNGSTLSLSVCCWVRGHCWICFPYLLF